MWQGFPARIRWFGALALLVAGVSACGSGGNGAVHTAPFELATISPASGNGGVALTAPIHVVFSHPVDPASVNEENFVVTSADGERIRGSLEARALTPTSVTFIPRAPMQLRMEHRVWISASIRDIDGATLPHDYSSVFSTRGAGAPIALPSGGNGGGLPGRSCDPVGITVVYSDFNGLFHVLDPDTLESAQIGEGGHISHYRHRCVYWFLTTEPTGTKLPDGKFANRLIALSSDGERVTLIEATASRDIGRGSPYAVRWAKDDSFVSYTLNSFSGKLHTCYLTRIPVTWNKGVPSTDGNTEESLDNVGFDGNGNPKLVAHDWAPSGTRYTYELGKEIFTFHPASGQRVRIAQNSGTPEWSPVGPDMAGKIAYHRHATGPRLVSPDGTGDFAVLTGDNRWAHDTPPSWSPDGTRLAIGAAGSTGQLAIINADGSNLTVVFENAGRTRMFGWR